MDEFPLTDLEAVFLDVGGTLTAMDFHRIVEELAAEGAECTVDDLLRAEAAARPIVSGRLALRRPLENVDALNYFLYTILSKLPGGRGVEPDLAHRIAPRIFRPGESGLAWTFVLPRVKEGLALLRDLGLPLIAVSNSDGTAEKGLEAAGLRDSLDGVIDSHDVGVAKPDPAIFDHALELVKAPRERILHVGDMYFADIVGARRAGLGVMLLDPFGDWGDVDCETAPSLAAVANLIAAAR